MSDPKTSSGEPVEEPTAVDDIVGRANEGLADADAAGAAPAAEPPAAEPPAAEPVAPEPVVVADEPPSAANGWAAEAPAWATEDNAATTAYETPAATTAYDAAAATTAYETPPLVNEPAVTPSEPVMDAAPAAAAGAAMAPQPIFVQAPEAPRPKGNRAAAGAIGLIAALAFAALYLAVWLGVGAINGDVTAENAGTAALAALGTWALWVPTIVFFLAFWLVGAIINRGRWGVWVHIGLLVGFAAYGGHLLGQLFQAQFWTITASDGAAVVEGQLLAPLAIASFIIARELTIWFGAWAASRGKRVTELNLEAQHEYERTLEAGPQLVRV